MEHLGRADELDQWKSGFGAPRRLELGIERLAPYQGLTQRRQPGFRRLKMAQQLIVIGRHRDQDCRTVPAHCVDAGLGTLVGADHRGAEIRLPGPGRR